MNFLNDEIAAFSNRRAHVQSQIIDKIPHNLLNEMENEKWK